MAAMSQSGGIRLLDPTSTPIGQASSMAPRLATLDGKVIGLLHNDKRNVNLLLDGIYARLAGQYSLADAVRDRKPTTTRPAPQSMIEAMAAKVDAVVTAIGD